MLKIFWDRDNIAFICNRVNATEHSHCVLQAFLSLDDPLQVTVENERLSGKCIVVNKNAKHIFSCNNKISLSILIEPSSSFANELIEKIDGNYLICDNENITFLQQKAALLLDSSDKERYLSFIQDFAKYLGIKRKPNVIDDRIVELLDLLRNCDCYNHTIEFFADKIALSSGRLSHLFREQVRVPLKSYILFHQLEKAYAAILNGKSITDAAMLAGFDSPSHFASTVKKWTGMSVSASIKDSEFLKVFI